MARAVRTSRAARSEGFRPGVSDDLDLGEAGLHPRRSAPGGTEDAGPAAPTSRGLPHGDEPASDCSCWRAGGRGAGEGREAGDPRVARVRPTWWGRTTGRPAGLMAPPHRVGGRRSAAPGNRESLDGRRPAGDPGAAGERAPSSGRSGGTASASTWSSSRCGASPTSCAPPASRWTSRGRADVRRGSRRHRRDARRGASDGADVVVRARVARAPGRRAGALEPVPLSPGRLRGVGGRAIAGCGWRTSTAGSAGASAILMDGDAPSAAGGTSTAENREPPPRGAAPWRARRGRGSTTLDRAVLSDLPPGVVRCPARRHVGDVARRRARPPASLRRVRPARLRPAPGRDARRDRGTSPTPSLSPYLNLGLLHPREVCDAAEAAYRAGDVPLASVEGFIRQIIGWREYVWGVYWLWMPACAAQNALGADRAAAAGLHRRRAHADALRRARPSTGVEEHGYAHHIQRLMVLGNLGLLAGVAPQAMVDWMWASFVDGAEWVMLPNVIGMAPARRRRPDDDEAVRRRRRVHRPHERLLRRLPVRPEAAHRRRRVPVHDALLGLPRPARGALRAEPAHRPAVRGLARLADLPAVRERRGRCWRCSTPATSDRTRAGGR